MTSAKQPLLLGTLALLGVLVLMGVVALSPWGRHVLRKEPPKGNALPPAPVTGEGQEQFQSAFREARLAQESAEKLSEMLSRLEINRQLIKANQARRQPDAEAIEAFRLAEQTIEREILDAEAALLLHTKELRAYPPETQAQAFIQLEKEVSRVGVSWRTELTQLLRRRLPNIATDATGVEPAFREELRKLQSPP